MAQPAIDEGLPKRGWSAFDYFITHDWTVCKNCFARTHIINHIYDQDKLHTSLKGVLRTDVSRTRDAITDYLPDFLAADCQRTACGNCGVIDRKKELIRPAPKPLSIEFATNLSDRVEETFGLSLEAPDSLVEEVERLKSNRNNQWKNNRLYALAFDNTVTVDYRAVFSDTE